MSSSSPFRRSRSPAGGGGTARHDVLPSRTMQHPPPPQYPYPQQQDYLQPPPPPAAQRYPNYYYHHHQYPYQYQQDPSSFIITPDAQQPQNITRYDSWQNMTRTLAHYDVCEQIGEGTYGQVYRGLCKDTGQTVALKKMRIHHGGYWGMPLQLVREIKILKRLHHPNLLELIEVITSKGVEHLDPDDTPKQSAKGKKTEGSDAVVVSDREDPHESYKGNLFLVLEYVSHDLTGLIDTGYDFQPVHIKCIVKQLLQALAYMHQNKYIHRDIKTSNVLLDEYFRLKLADFGLARSMEPPITEQLQPAGSSGSSKEHLTNKVITLWYRPPEILVGGTQYGPAVDVWSAGCILAELMLGKPLFAGKTELDQFNLIVDMLGNPDADTWKYLQTLCKKGRSTNMPMDFARPKPSRLRDKYSKKMPASALSLLEKLLEWDPRKRLTAKNALEQRYFWVEPVAPDDPSQLGRVLKEGVHFHEFQTKKKRKQAKAKGEEAREEALKNGATDDEAQAAFDEVYQGMMKQVAEEGFAFEEPETVMASAVEVAQKRGRTPDGRHDEESKERRHRDRRRSSSRSRDERRRSRKDNDHRREEDRRTGSEEHKKKDDRVSNDSKHAVDEEQDQSKRRSDDQLTDERKSKQSDDRPAEKPDSRKQEEERSSRGSRERDDVPPVEEGNKGRKRQRRDRSRRKKDKRRRERKDNRDRGERDRDRERDRHREREGDERDRMERDRVERDRMERDRNDRRRDYDREHGRDYGREYERDREIEFGRDRHRDRPRELERPPWDDRGRDDRYRDRDRGPRPPGPDDVFRRYGPDEEFRRYGPPGHRTDMPPPEERGHIGRHPPLYDDREWHGGRGRDEGRFPADRPHDRERYRGPGPGGRDRDRR